MTIRLVKKESNGFFFLGTGVGHGTSATAFQFAENQLQPGLVCGGRWRCRGPFLLLRRRRRRSSSRWWRRRRRRQRRRDADQSDAARLDAQRGQRLVVGGGALVGRVGAARPLLAGGGLARPGRRPHPHRHSGPGSKPGLHHSLEGTPTLKSSKFYLFFLSNISCSRPTWGRDPSSWEPLEQPLGE